jgi:hypothetical protein
MQSTREETEMVKPGESKLNVVIAFWAVMVVTGLVLPVAAQEEPTPVPESPAEEPSTETTEEQPETADGAAVAGSEPADESAAAQPEPALASIPVSYQKKTLVKLDGKAKAHGVLELVVQPQGGDPVLIRINVIAKTGSKKITNDLEKELNFALDDRYKVKRYADKKIIVIAKNKNPPMAITVKAQSLPGVTVKIEKW